MAEDKTIPVEVAYAKPDIQTIISLDVKPGTTLIDAIKLSGILEQFPEIDLAQHKFGIFSKASSADTVSPRTIPTWASAEASCRDRL